MNSLQDVVETIRNAKRIMVLTGAGVSVSCGIPDFRSETGIYARLDEFELDDPQQMFDIHYFRENPQIFYSFAREIYPSNFHPSPSHMFVKLLEDKDVLLRNYTQNIDTLEHKAKITRVINCHGSFATATCVTCGYKCAGSDIEADIFAQVCEWRPSQHDIVMLSHPPSRYPSVFLNVQNVHR
jgi:NAD-dependent SIR2 family protein deacetylase